MLELIRPSKADLTLLQDRQIVVVGFGALAKAHALNLRDSGVDVRVAVPTDSRLRDRVEAEGFRAQEPAEAIRQADLVALLDALSERAGFLQREVLPHLEPGDAVLFGSPEPWRYGHLGDVPAGVDVIVLQVLSDAERLRQEFQDGHGVPCLLGVAQDGTGYARPVAAAYAQAMGSLRAGAIPMDVRRAAEAERFAERGVRPLLGAALEESFSTLVRAGFAPELAYLVTVHDLLNLAEKVTVDGLASISRPGVGQDDVAAPVRGALTDHLAGELARIRDLAPGEWVDPSLEADVEAVGRELRSLMSWIRA